VEGVVEVDGKNAEVKVGDVEGGGRDEDFGRSGVGEGVEGLFM
jgi:hypothetical protein